MRRGLALAAIASTRSTSVRCPIVRGATTGERRRWSRPKRTWDPKHTTVLTFNDVDELCPGQNRGLFGRNHGQSDPLRSAPGSLDRRYGGGLFVRGGARPPPLRGR